MYIAVTAHYLRLGHKCGQSALGSMGLTKRAKLLLSALALVLVLVTAAVIAVVGVCPVSPRASNGSSRILTIPREVFPE